MMRTFLLIFSVFALFINTAHGDANLIATISDATFSSDKPLSVEIYLYNDGKQSITVRPLRFTAAEWTLIDPSDKRLPRGGESILVADHGEPNMKVKPGEILHETVQFDVKAELGDLVRIQFSLAGETPLRGNSLLLYCGQLKTN
jgi:hypothetical protein